MKKILLPAVGTCLLLFTGCGIDGSERAGQPETPSNFTGYEKKSGWNQTSDISPIGNQVTDPAGDTGDPYVGNKAGEFDSVANKHHNIGYDQAMMRATVRRSKLFRPQMVAVIGNQAYVRVAYLKKEGSAARDAKVLQQKLQNQMPRYKVHLKVTNR